VPHVQRPHRVGADELHLDLPAAAHVRHPEAGPLLHYLDEDAPDEMGCQVEVDEARAGDLDALDDVRRFRQSLGDYPCDFPGVLPHFTRQCERHVSGPIAVLLAVRAVELYVAGVDLGQQSLRDRLVEGLLYECCDLFFGHVVPATGPARSYC